MRQLYHFPLLPLCRKARIHLKEKELEHELVHENFWDNRPEFLALNPAGEMPLLVDSDGLVISGSAAITEYLEEVYPYHPLLGNSPSERAEIRRLMAWFDVRFCHEVTQPILDEKIFKKLVAHAEPDSRLLRRCKDQLLYHLDYIANLTRARHWLAGENELTLADISAAAQLSALDYLGDVPWEHSPEAKEWYALMKSRPSMRGILADRLPSFRPPAHYDNPDF